MHDQAKLLQLQHHHDHNYQLIGSYNTTGSGTVSLNSLKTIRQRHPHYYIHIVSQISMKMTP